MDKLVNKVYETIRRERLLQPGGRVVVGVSGGADSVALLLILHELAPVLKLDLSVAHFNHRWRGKESDADQAFVAALAGRLDLPFSAGRAAKKPAKNREAAARDDRYRFLRATTIKAHAAAITVAHHADDQAETFLINLLRGAGPDGLAGMAAAGPAPGSPSVRLVRPLLGVTRAELRDYLDRVGQNWREDSSNLDVDFLRNRVRAELLPLLATINPAIAETLGRTAAILREQSEAARVLAEGWVTENVVERDGEVLLPLGPLRPLPPALRVSILRVALRRLAPGLARVSRRHLLDLDRLASAPGHGSLSLPGLVANKQYDFLAIVGGSVGGALGPRHRDRVEQKEDRGRKAPPTNQEESRGQKAPPTNQEEDRGRKAPPTRQEEGRGRKAPPTRILPVPGQVEWPGLEGEMVIISARRGRVPADRDFSATAAIDPAKVSGGLRVRGRRPGDRYRPAGSPGRRSLKDIFNELRVPPADRDRWPLVVDDEEIVWVPGMRPAEKVAARGKGPVVVIRKK